MLALGLIALLPLSAAGGSLEMDEPGWILLQVSSGVEFTFEADLYGGEVGSAIGAYAWKGPDHDYYLGGHAHNRPVAWADLDVSGLTTFSPGLNGTAVNYGVVTVPLPPGDYEFAVISYGDFDRESIWTDPPLPMIELSHGNRTWALDATASGGTATGTIRVLSEGAGVDVGSSIELDVGHTLIGYIGHSGYFQAGHQTLSGPDGDRECPCLITDRSQAGAAGPGRYAFERTRVGIDALDVIVFAADIAFPP